MSYLRNIKTTYWKDSKVCDFTAEAKYLFLYFITAPESTMTGCYEVSITTIQNDTGLPRQKIIKAISELEQNNVIRYDSITSEVLILHYNRHNWGNSPSVVRNVEKLMVYIKSDSFKEYVSSLISDELEAEIPPCGEGVDTLSTSSKSKSKSVSIPIPDIAITETNQSSQKSIDEFEMFWKEYPKKKEKGFALSAWKEMKPPIDKVIESLKRQKRSQSWKTNGGQYIPYPAKWLKGRSWEDEETRIGAYSIDATDPHSYDNSPDERNKLNELLNQCN